jgi:hypothetical protein
MLPPPILSRPELRPTTQHASVIASAIGPGVAA